METSSSIADAFSITNAYGCLSVSAKLVARYSLSLSALDSIAPPAVVRTGIFRHASAPSALARRSMRRIRRRTHTEGGGEDDGFFGDGDDGPFGGGGDGGRGWNSGDSGPCWDGSGESSSSDPAFDLIMRLYAGSGSPTAPTSLLRRWVGFWRRGGSRCADRIVPG